MGRRVSAEARDGAPWGGFSGSSYLLTGVVNARGLGWREGAIRYFQVSILVVPGRGTSLLSGTARPSTVPEWFPEPL